MLSSLTIIQHYEEGHFKSVSAYILGNDFTTSVIDNSDVVSVLSCIFMEKQLNIALILCVSVQDFISLDYHFPCRQSAFDLFFPSRFYFLINSIPRRIKVEL